MVTVISTVTSVATAVIDLYVDGFRNLHLGKTLWALIALKLLLFFGIMKIFFFPDFLHSTFESDPDRSTYVLEHLTKD